MWIRKWVSGVNYDITFCSNKECKKIDCKRHYTNEPKDRYISIGRFEKCEYWENSGQVEKVEDRKMFVDIYNTDKKYNIIYADPPWNYGDKMTGHSFSLEHEYPTMKKEDIWDMGEIIKK